ncbi:hypothetical protein N0V88_001152 [Collariella sp. IMI 366227]|nr:hypothetical protein N0V88_001152 [Collariella sp. IMI 366227]
MDFPASQPGASADAPPPAATRSPASGRKRSSSGAGGLLSKLPFMRSTGDHRQRPRRNTLESEQPAPPPSLPIPSFITIPAEPAQRHVPAASPAPPTAPHALQQQQTLQLPQQIKTRRRRGSLRKVALLGRGVQRERREGRRLSIDTKVDLNNVNGPPSSLVRVDGRPKHIPILINTSGNTSPYGLGISDLTPRPSMDGYTTRAVFPTSDPDATPIASKIPTITTNTPTPPKRESSTSDVTPSINYSTTDDEDALHMTARSTNPSIPVSLTSSAASLLLRPERTTSSLSSGSESYFLSHSRPPSSPSLSVAGSPSSNNNSIPTIHRRRPSIQRAKSPLALTSLSPPLPTQDADWDYAETEWWGWIILVVTWTVWAWDVGTTPYAPPELEDDPTLPIVGYYPSLIILTGVMAWVWVLVAWVGMKYFRHAQVSGD